MITTELASSRIGAASSAVIESALYARPEGTSSHSISSIRLLQRRVALTPALARRKVFIVGDAESFMRGLHIAAEIVRWSAESHAQKLQHQLVILAHTVATLAFPVDAQSGIACQSRHQLRNKLSDRVVSARTRGGDRELHRVLPAEPGAGAAAAMSDSAVRIGLSISPIAFT